MILFKNGGEAHRVGRRLPEGQAPQRARAEAGLTPRTSPRSPCGPQGCGRSSAGITCSRSTPAAPARGPRAPRRRSRAAAPPIRTGVERAADGAPSASAPASASTTCSGQSRSTTGSARVRARSPGRHEARAPPLRLELHQPVVLSARRDHERAGGAHEPAEGAALQPPDRHDPRVLARAERGGQLVEPRHEDRFVGGRANRAKAARDAGEALLPDRGVRDRDRDARRPSTPAPARRRRRRGRQHHAAPAPGRPAG